MGCSAFKQMATMIHRFVLLIALLQQRAIYSYAVSSNQNPGASTLAPPTKIKLTYFDFEGKGEPVRLALTLAGVPFQDERVQFADWSALKPSTPYGQLPLLTIHDEKGESVKAQSMAMLRWVANEFAPDTLYPRDCMYDIEEALGVVEDMISSWQPCLYVGMRPQYFGHPAGYEKTEEGIQMIQTMREQWIQEKLPVYAKHLECLLAKHDHQFLASSSAPTIADCVAIPFLRSFTRGFMSHVPATCLDAHPVVVDYIKRFCALDKVKGRYDSGIH